jgi:dihydrofolate reductase
VGRTRYYTATTLDGFIADEHHSLDWLFSRAREEGGMLDYGAFIAEVGALAMGSTTYEWILDHELVGKEPSAWRWPYAQPTWVFTHRTLPAIPEANITFTSEPVPDVHRQMTEAAAGKDIWLVGGGDLVGQFADAGLLDDVLVTIAPVTLGAGAPLLPRRLELRLEEVGRNGDFACARYTVARPEA